VDQPEVREVRRHAALPLGPGTENMFHLMLPESCRLGQ
jgi:hypothetical protein